MGGGGEQKNLEMINIDNLYQREGSITGNGCQMNVPEFQLSQWGV